MGFLDHSTNNIIIDAVLTDEGRRLLAANDGSFRISMFSLADDEVDYGLIKKFGRSVGKEKISKNTPVFEAQTRHQLALKYRLLTLPSQTETHIPGLTLTAGGGGGSWSSESETLTFYPNQATKDLTIIQQFANAGAGVPGVIPEGLADSSFMVLVPNRFIRLTNAAGFVSLTPNSQIASYKVMATQAGGIGQGGQAILSFTAKEIEPQMFSVFGTASNASVIRSVISIIGDQSGLRKDITVKFNQNNQA